MRPVIANAMQRHQYEDDVETDKSGVAHAPSVVATIMGALVCPQGG